jgi:hypothetical protein
LVDREQSSGGQELTAVANLAFKMGLRSQEVMEAVEALEVKLAEGLEVKPVPLLAPSAGESLACAELMV